MRRLSAIVALMLGVALAACGGSGGGGSESPPPGSTNTQNPCATAADAPEGDTIPGSPLTADAPDAKRNVVDGTPRNRVLDALWVHEQQGARGGERQGARAISAADVGDVAVVQDQGDIILAPNTFDLAGTGIRFTRNGGGYDA